MRHIPSCFIIAVGTALLGGISAGNSNALLGERLPFSGQAEITPPVDASALNEVSKVRAELARGLSSGLGYTLHAKVQFWMGTGPSPATPQAEPQRTEEFDLQVSGGDYVERCASGDVFVSRKDLSWHLTPSERSVMISEGRESPYSVSEFLPLLLQSKDHLSKWSRKIVVTGTEAEVPQIVSRDGPIVLSLHDREFSGEGGGEGTITVELQRLGRSDTLQLAAVKLVPEQRQSSVSEVRAVRWEDVDGRDVPSTLEYRSSSGEYWAIIRWTVSAWHAHGNGDVSWTWPAPPAGWSASCPRIGLQWVIGAKEFKLHGVTYTSAEPLDHELPRKLPGIIDAAAHLPAPLPPAGSGIARQPLLPPKPEGGL